MSAPAAVAEAIEHLDEDPKCSRPVPHLPGKATWWGSGHACGDRLWCATCVEGVRSLVSLGLSIFCTQCGAIFSNDTEFFGELGPL